MGELDSDLVVNSRCQNVSGTWIPPLRSEDIGHVIVKSWTVLSVTQGAVILAADISESVSSVKLSPIGDQPDVEAKYHNFVICMAAEVTSVRSERLPFATGNVMIFYVDEQGSLPSLCPVADQHLVEVIMERLAEYTFSLRGSEGMECCSCEDGEGIVLVRYKVD